MKAAKIIAITMCLTALFTSCQEDEALQTPSAVVVPPIIGGPVNPNLLFRVKLDRINLFMSKDSRLKGTVTAYVVEAANGNVAAQTTIDVSSINNFAAKWTTFLYGGASLKMGTLYRIEVVCSSRNDVDYLSWYADTNNYLDGTMGVNGSSMTGDLSFKTYYRKTIDGQSRIVLGQQSRGNSLFSYVANKPGLIYWQEFKTEPIRLQ